ncbi:MAG: MBL fold metallo-hydrolase [Dehalococcoidales bacterium]|nr:MBL fold metallo-hydrolase [Dehalococcoidales bacterium]
MKIKYLAHASFLITADDGTKVITDPYKAGDGFKYGAITGSADIVTMSHEHGDHNYADGIGGNPEIVKGSATVKGITIKAVPTAHDDKGGSERGPNNVMCFVVSGVRVVHLGDLGHLLTDNQVVEIGKVHVLLVPVGGHFTIDAGAAKEVADQVRARVIIPMHYKTDKCELPINGVDEFLKARDNVTMVDGSEVEFTVPKLPSSPQIMVLKPSL